MTDKMDALDRSLQLMRLPMYKLPPLALGFARFLGRRSGGICMEVLITAYAVYAQMVEGLPCKDDLYRVRDIDKAWFIERGHTGKSEEEKIVNKQEFKFNTKLNERFIDYIFIKASVAQSKLIPESKDAGMAEWQRRDKAGIPHDIVFQVDGFDLPVVEAFEEYKKQIEADYDSAVRRDALALVKEHFVTVFELLETVKANTERAVASKLGLPDQE